MPLVPLDPGTLAAVRLTLEAGTVYCFYSMQDLMDAVRGEIRLEARRDRLELRR